MTKNHYIFADEAGCFTFTRTNHVSKYFILCTVTMENCSVANALAELRRTLIWEGHGEFLDDYFHATTDSQLVRDRVYEVLSQHDFLVQATIMEKAKAQPQIRKSKPTFYQYGWYYHFKHGMPSIISNSDRVLVSAASVGTKKEKYSFSNAIENVMKQTVRNEWKVDFRACKSDPCLQVADYCAWAIQRKWERGCNKSYDLIESKITREFDLWQKGNQFFY